MRPAENSLSFTERLQVEATEPEPVKVTSEMLNAIAPRAVAIMENDLRDFTSIHRDDRTVYATIGTQSQAILKATEKAVNHIVRDMSKPLPENCTDLATRLRDPANLDVMHHALRDAGCGAFYFDAVKEDFGKMMRKLAKETDQACQKGLSI